MGRAGWLQGPLPVSFQRGSLASAGAPANGLPWLFPQPELKGWEVSLVPFLLPPSPKLWPPSSTPAPHHSSPNRISVTCSLCELSLATRSLGPHPLVSNSRQSHLPQGWSGMLRERNGMSPATHGFLPPSHLIQEGHSRDRVGPPLLVINSVHILQLSSSNKSDLKQNYFIFISSELRRDIIYLPPNAYLVGPSQHLCEIGRY